MGFLKDIFHGPIQHGKLIKKKIKKVTSKGEEAAVYDVEKTKGNSYNATNRALIRKLKVDGAKKGKAGTAQIQWF